MKKRWGKILKECRKEKGISQEQLAEEVGVSPKTVGFWETGRRGMTLDHATKAFTFLGYNINLQIGEENE